MNIDGILNVFYPLYVILLIIFKAPAGRERECVCVCVCEREREFVCVWCVRESERESVCVCVVCVRERRIKREKNGKGEKKIK